MKRGAAAVVLIVPREYPPRFAAALPAPVFLVADSSDSQTRKSADRLRALIAGYGGGIAQLRSQIRGVSPLLAVPIAVNDIDVTTPTGRAVVVLGFMTYFVLFSVLDGRAVSRDRFDRGRARARLARGVAEPAGGAHRTGRRQAPRDVRLHVPVARDQSHRVRGACSSSCRSSGSA